MSESTNAFSESPTPPTPLPREVAQANAGISIEEFKEDLKQPEGHISHSQVSTYMRCPATVYWRYVKGYKSAPTGPISFGVSIHEALEYNFKQKLYSKKDVPLSVMEDVFRDKWRVAEKQTIFDPSNDDGPEEMLEQGLKLIRMYAEYAERIQPRLIEQRFTMRLPGLDREVLGYIDLVDENEIIIDHKTTGKLPTDLALAKAPQLTLYKMGYRQMFGREPGGLRNDYLVRRSSKKTGSWVEIHPKPVIRTASHERAVIATFTAVAASIKACEFYPNMDGWTCGPTTCGHWSRCAGKILAGESTPFLDEIHEMRRVAREAARLEKPA